MYTATCLRRTANWSVLDKEHKFDKPTFNPKRFLQDLPIASPKLLSLLLKIKSLDENDFKTEGKIYKHVIFSDVKAGGYGARVISSALIASGFNLAFTDKLKLKPETDMLNTSYRNFGILCSTEVFGDKISTELKKGLLDTYNKRPENIHGQLMRIIVLDAGFKEGIDLFDVKYLHVFEPQITDSDLKQVIGRGTRKCGQKGLEFNPQSGWTLNVYIYDTTVPPNLFGKYNSQSLYDLYIQNSNFDMQKLNFGKHLEALTIRGAVDYPLNRNIHEFKLGASDFLSGGGKKKKKSKPSNPSTVSLPKALDKEIIMHQDETEIVSAPAMSEEETVTMPRKKATPPKLGDEVICQQTCSINRPSKYVPVSQPLFVAVAFVLDVKLPDKKSMKPREHFCKLLKTNKAFCKEVQTAFKDQAGYVSRHARVLLSAIESDKHLRLRSSLRHAFLRFFYKLVSEKVQQKIVQLPNVQRSLLGDLEDYGVDVRTIRGTTQSPRSQSIVFPEPPVEIINKIKDRVVEVASPLVPKIRSASVAVATQPVEVLSKIKDRVSEAASTLISSSPLLKSARKRQSIPNISSSILTRPYDNEQDAEPIKRATSRRLGLPLKSNPLVNDMEQRKTNKSAVVQLPIDEELSVDEESKDGTQKSQRVALNKVDVFKYLLDNIPVIDKKMSFAEMQEYIVDNYSAFAWPQIKIENQCVPKGGNASTAKETVNKEIKNAVLALNKGVNHSVIASFTPTQEFLRHYFTPSNPYKGMLLWHSVGSGKTCTAIATATSTFEKQGYTILWVTRTTLKDDIWKNMFDVVCSLSMQEKLSKGVKFPPGQTDKMKLLSNSWSIRPMSYKSFTNLVSGKNKIYQDLVKKNGTQDPLRKTLIIIDEAHKLYGGHDLLPSEKPDMRKLKASLQKSYQISGQNSVKLLLMTATPLTSDPMELVKLINLCKDNNDQIPASFEEFSQVFLDKMGNFTKDGKELYLNMISGVVSYLNREGDVREFAQPSIQLVNTYMSQIPTGDITGLKKEHDKNVQSIKDILRQLDDSYESFADTKRQQIANEIKENCGHLKGQEYIDCRNSPSAFVQLLENSIIDMGTKINEIKEEHMQEIQKLNDNFNRIKMVYDNSISQEHVIDKTCKKQETKTSKKNTANVSSE